MLRKWRRSMKRRLEDESGGISVKSGAVVSAVLGSAVAVLVYTANLDETTDQNHAVVAPPSVTASDKNSNVSPQLPEPKIAKEETDIKKNVIEKLEPIVVEEPVENMSQQAVADNTASVEEEPANASVEAVVQEDIIVVKEEVVVIADVTTANVDGGAEKTGESMSKPVIDSEKEIITKPIVSLNKRDAKDVPVTISKQKSEDPIAKVDIIKKSNIPIITKEKKVEDNDKSKAITVASKTGANLNDEKPIVEIDKISNSRTEIKPPFPEDAIIIDQPKVESEVIVSEAIKRNNNEKDIQATTTPVIVEETLEKELVPTVISPQVAADDLLDEKQLTSDTITLQSVDSSPNSYTIKDTSDGVTCMTVVPKINEQASASTSILANTDITVFQVKNGNASYNGTYYIENNKSGLTMAQRVSKDIREANPDPTTAQGTYMTMKWKDNPGSDFFVGFSGSSLVVYPLDNEAKVIVSDTDSVNNRPIVASSIIEAVGNMKVGLAQIQSVSIYAE